MLLSGIWLFEFGYTLKVEFLANLHGNGRMRVCKNSSHCQSTPHARTDFSVKWYLKVVQGQTLRALESR